MKVLLTGSTGFIGTELGKMLEDKNHEVIRMVRYVSGGRFDSYSGDKHLVFADLRDREAVRQALMQTRPEVVIHLAAQAAVSYSFRNPVDVNEVNLIGTINLAEAAREAGVQHMMHASTSEVYGNGIGASFPLREDERLSPTSPYAVSKIGAEMFLRLLWEIEKFPVTIFRPFNSYGRANVQNRHYVVERAITQALLEHKISLHDPKPYRDFVFRTDHARLYTLALENRGKVIGEVINGATGSCWSIKEMAETIRDIVMLDMDIAVDVTFSHSPDRPCDILKLHGDSTKARNLLGWKPEYNFRQGLVKAVWEWKSVLGVGR